MKLFIFLTTISIFISCNSSGKRPVMGKTRYQQELNTEFKDASISPLTKKDLKNFKGLDFFPIDSAYIVNATLTKTPEAMPISFPTTTKRVAIYKPYGVVTFELKKTSYTLTVYKDQSNVLNPAYKNLLFLPFTDATSGNTSYSGGRYMDLFTTDEKNDGTIVLNFNNTYNPYCAYNKKYSCPMPPQENHLPIAIEAGIKNFKK
ncbi:DUF1684 domain-containing protein [Tenacibaculum maritimum]|uniref:DUF1684 domain-containing protein n=1 Tax=Tenacibaculum maritimum TaxID=107401 RepID=UPI00041BC63E|nr:DUF1684 domain-containing protein [Tenacibaculum maritimum]